jgi:hypothetical protein
MGADPSPDRAVSRLHLPKKQDTSNDQNVNVEYAAKRDDYYLL